MKLKKFSTTFILGLMMLSPIVCFVLDNYQVQFMPERFIGLCACLLLISAIGLIPFKISHRAIPYQFHFIQSRFSLSAIFILCLLLPLVVSKYWLGIATLALIYILLGLGLNIVVGWAGMLNLGFVAFYAVGAYTYALSAEYLHLGFWSALPLAALVSALFGMLLAFPVLKMVGDYLAIVTLGFAEITRIVITNWGDVTGGPNGLSVPAPTLLGLEFTRSATQQGTPFHEFFNIAYNTQYKTAFIYFVLLFVVVITIAALNRLRRMPIGLAWEALREDEVACRSLGINHVTTKVSAFSIGAMLGGLGGVFFAAMQGFVSPASFTFVESALILSIVVLGGMGSMLGVILAAIVLTLLPEVLRDFSDYRMLFFGALMVLMMIWKPEGLIKLERRTL